MFTGWSALGNSNGANPFLFRDNQFTADVNLSWTKGRHATKYGFTYYHFDLNHFQPTSGSRINAPRGGFRFQGGLTTGPLTSTSSGAAKQHQRLHFAGRLPAGPAQQRHRRGRSKAQPALQSQRSALDRSTQPMHRTSGP